MYNSFDYWNKRFHPNKRHSKILDFESEPITLFLRSATTVLDFGIGVGRTLPLYQRKRVTGVDFASQYQNRVTKYAKKLGLDYTHLVWNVHDKALPFEENTFDAGLVVKVLLHAPEKEARRILTQVGRVCKRVLVITFHGETRVEHCFGHNTPHLIKDCGFTILDQRVVRGNQMIVSYE